MNRWKKIITSKFLWLRYFYPHIFAHKPLCNRFEDDVIRLGQTYLCRSCSILYLMAFFTFISSLFYLPDKYIVLVKVVFIFTMLLTAFYSHPQIYSKQHRLTKDFLRGLAGGIVGIMLYLLSGGSVSFCIFSTLFLFGVKGYYNNLRKTNYKCMCYGCEELNTNKICSGFTKQANAFRQYEQKVYDLILVNNDIKN